jgi:hypothetical protein
VTDGTCRSGRWRSVTAQLTATEVFDPLNLFGNGAMGAVLDPGSVTCPGTRPTGNPMQPCPVGSRINLRGLSTKSRVVSEGPLLTGWLYSEGNGNFDANATGHVWGTFRLELDSGGTSFTPLPIACIGSIDARIPVSPPSQ